MISVNRDLSNYLKLSYENKSKTISTANSKILLFFLNGIFFIYVVALHLGLLIMPAYDTCILFDLILSVPKCSFLLEMLSV